MHVHCTSINCPTQVQRMDLLPPDDGSTEGLLLATSQQIGAAAQALQLA